MRFRFNRAKLLVAVISFAIVIWAEWYGPSKAFDQCRWPLGPTARHVAMIADPQLVDDNTYPGRNSIAMWFTRVVADRYMARNFRLLHRRMQPDAVFFLGDLFDGGREWDIKPWKDEYRRFMQIFPTSPRASHHYNLPGNHDVGSADDIIASSYERFRQAFGEPNQVHTVGEHSFVTLDTNALMSDTRESIRDKAKEFLEKLKQSREEYDPIILLTHIPLYRPEGSYCGFEREGTPLRWEKGHQYITELSPTITSDLLFGLKPVYIFSGDDHDHCKYTHHSGLEDSSEEYTVKSFSMAMGISRPGFQLVSVDSRNRQATESCLLGEPFKPIICQAFAYGVLITIYWVLSISFAKKGYAPLPVSDVKTNAAPGILQLRPSRDFYQGVGYITLAWIIGQAVVNWWSYSPRL